MPDFVIIFDAEPPSSDEVEFALRNRPGMEELSARSWRFPWGLVTVMESRCFGYTPCESEESLDFAVGRPRVMGWTHEDDGPSGFTKCISDLASSDNICKSYLELTGLFMLASCRRDSVTLFTDRMGAYAVYDAKAPNRSRRVLGTMPEIVAKLADRQDDFDFVSLAEILTSGSATFPYTSRNGMTELSPGSKHTFQVKPDRVSGPSSQSLWEPREPDRWPSLAESRDQLIAALEFTGKDITRGCHRVAVTLSGGADSRTTLSIVPPHLRAMAITYADHFSTESRVAGEIAKAAATPHYIAMRSPHFYAETTLRETQLLGIERGEVHSHGFALKLNMPQDSFDLLLCGDKSDTLLKSLYHLTKTSRFLRAIQDPYTIISDSGKPLIKTGSPNRKYLELFQPDVVEHMRHRMQKRLREISAIRPHTAKEWYCFYPLSRHEHMSYSLGNMRHFPSDQPFIHSRMLDVATEARLDFKKSRRLTTSAFAKICGPLAKLIDTNSGLPSNTTPLGYFTTVLIQKLRKRISLLWKESHHRSDLEYPWYSEGSWVEFDILHAQSQVWMQINQSLPKSDTLESNLLLSGTQSDDLMSSRFLSAGHQSTLTRVRHLIGKIQTSQ